MTQAPQPEPPTPVPYGRYLLALSVLAFLFYPLPFFLIRAPHFERWSTSPYGRDLEYGITAAHLDADVVIYGDSTALYGLDPQRMSQELGLKVFNIPNLLPSLRVTNDLGLTRYLASNKPPRLIVLYLSPWDLDYTSLQSTDILYDGDEMLLRHGTAAQIGAFYSTHPTEYLQFPFMFYRVNSPAGLFHPSTEQPGVALTGGHKQISPTSRSRPTATSPPPAPPPTSPRRPPANSSLASTPAASRPWSTSRPSPPAATPRPSSPTTSHGFPPPPPAPFLRPTSATTATTPTPSPPTSPSSPTSS